jgi:hypothetical protein
MNAPLISSKERQLIQYLLNRRMHEVEKYLSRYIVLSGSNYETGSWLQMAALHGSEVILRWRMHDFVFLSVFLPM